MFETGGRLSIKGIIAVFLIVIPFSLGFISHWLTTSFGADRDTTRGLLYGGYMLFLFAIVVITIYRDLKPIVINIMQKLKSYKQS